MLLCFDIGNTNIVVGSFKGQELAFEFRLKTEPGRTVDEYSVLLSTLISARLGTQVSELRSQFTGAVICSVVPPITPDIVALVRSSLGIEPLVIGPGVKTGVRIKTADPTAVGADRIVNALAVRELYGSPAVVVDFGTATTFDLVNNDGEYEGGIIAPGIGISMEALVRNTAKLPRIELAWPQTIVGKSTVSAMQSGAVVGYMCLVDGLIDRIMAEVGPIQHLVSTGGLGQLFTEHSQRLSSYEPHLTLKGMRIIAGLNGI